MTLAVLAVLGGIACLWVAADEFVTGATRLALIFKVSPVIIGALVIGFGTSAPELLVSSLAAAGGDIDVGVGNIIGSNIANLSLILGAASLFLTIGIGPGVIKREAPLSVGSAILFAIAVQFDLGPVWGVILLSCLAAALWWIVRSNAGAESDEVTALAGAEPPVAWLEWFRTLVGMAATIGGAWVLVWGALDLADRMGVSGGFIGVTLVAIGTSLPELVTAVAAARAGQSELIVGNLLGSNLFNSLAVGGVVSMLGSGPLGDPSLATLDIGMMLVVVIGSFVAMWTRRRFERMEGIVLLAVFVAFLVVSTVAEQA